MTPFTQICRSDIGRAETRAIRAHLFWGLTIIALVLNVAAPTGASPIWRPVGGGVTGDFIRFLHVWNGELVAAGEFAMAGGVPANRIASWDGTMWSPLGDGLDAVAALATHNGQLIALGTTPGSVALDIVMWDGNSWSLIVASNGEGLASFNGKLYQTEDWSDSYGEDGYCLVREYAAGQWQTVGFWPTFTSGAGAKTDGLTVLDGELYVNTYPTGHVRSYDGVNWKYHGSTPLKYVSGFVMRDGKLHAAGHNPVFLPCAFQRNGGTWETVYEDWTGTCYGAMNAALVFEGYLVLGGALQHPDEVECAVPNGNVLRWDGNSWEEVAGQMDHSVLALAEYDGSLIAAGYFTSAGGVTVQHVAQLSEPIVAVTISSFTAKSHNDGVALSWEVAADETFDGFDVYRSIGGASDIRLNDNALLPSVRYYVDRSVTPGSRYSYLLVAKGTSSGEVHSPRAEVAIPDLDVALHQNVPNPFNPETTIRFVVAEREHVAITVYGPDGQKVRSLVDEVFAPGEWATTWDGTDDSGNHMASGVYFYRMRIGKVERSRKMVLLK